MLVGTAPSLLSIQGDLEYLSSNERRDRPALVRKVEAKARERGNEVRRQDDLC